MRNKFIILGIVFSIILAITAKTQAIIRFDLENLRNQDTLLVKAYDIVKIQESWEKILNSGATLSSVVAGIVDTGVDATHQEFNNPKVDFGSSSPTALIDSESPDGHGTQVANIIGANNVLGAGLSLPANSPQMNGIISGILRENQYKLEVENYKAISGKQTIGSLIALENILKRNPSVVNMSFAVIKCSAISWARRQILGIGNDCYKTDAEFTTASEAYARIFDAEKIKNTTLFVSAAGNWDIDTYLNVLPVTINLPNVMTVGATDLNDGRATFIPLIGAKSNFGSDIDVSAPGINVYTAKPNNTYTNSRGTSVSAPFVTGTVAILKSLENEYKKYKPDLVMNPATIKDILQKSADPIITDQPLGNGCFDPNNNPEQYTGCRLNAYKAVDWYFPPTSSTLSYSDLTSDSVKISWTKNEDPDFASYRLARVISLQPLVTELVASSDDPNFTSFTVTGLTPDTFYQYGLRTYDQAGLFSPSSNLIFITTPPQPSTLSISATTTNSVSLSWSQYPGLDFKEYWLYRTTLVSGFLSTDLIATISNQAQTSFTDTNLSSGIYDYYLETYNQSNLFSRSNEVRAILPFLVPYANIIVDGDISDWQGISPAIVDKIGDKLGDYSGTDIDKIYLAKDNDYLYLRIDLADGPPNPDLIGYHTNFTQNLIMAVNDYYSVSSYFTGDWRTFLFRIGPDDVGHSQYVYDDSAAVGSSLLETRVQFSYLSDSLIFYIATHDNRGPGIGFDWAPMIEARF